MEHSTMPPAPGAPPPDPLAPGQGSPRRAALGAMAALTLAGVAVGAYLLGRSAADPAGAQRAGFTQGRAETARRFAPGAPGYQRIFRSGFQSGLRGGRAAGLAAGQRQGQLIGAEKGRKLGLEEGKEIGDLEGERQGIESGAGAALGGFSSWRTGGLYVVAVASGDQGSLPHREAQAADSRSALRDLRQGPLRGMHRAGAQALSPRA